MKLILIVIAIIVVLAILAFFIRRLNKTIKIYKAEAEFARCIISDERAHYQKMTEMYETLSSLRHDFKYYLKKIDELLQTGDIEKTKLYLTEIKKRIPESGLHYYCTDHAVNSLLTSYAKDCEKLNIEYNIKIALPNQFSIPRYDTCIILCNLLENALEACKKLEKGREIDLAIKTGGQRIAIKVENSFDGVVSENANLRSVKAIAERYGGHISIERTESVFTIYVMVNA
ncbi:MAG: GHKL domain-containing protein [Fibromonadaceae bacterium]|jgi:sensor histidine kinase regulating citrate/malate metabolism|nr:GHKL domain-containing protein [Fibromonadaceae bacterium]